MYYVDVHTHLTHEKFSGDFADIINHAEKAGLKIIVVNGLHPTSNRQVLKMASQHPIVKAALGIYPVDAVHSLLPKDFTLDVERFDVQDEIKFIKERASKKEIIAIGECGLDGYWVKEDTFSLQEKIFESLLEIAMNHDIPAIIHSRKREERAIDILKVHGTKKAVFHCFGGRLPLARKVVEDYGWHLSIPANAAVNEAFHKMLQTFPLDKLLTETDAPYLSPVRGTRNEPANVVKTVELLAKLRNLSVEEARDQIWNNFLSIF